jgi:peptide/nickel transport system ATP-binding protein
VTVVVEKGPLLEARSVTKIYGGGLLGRGATVTALSDFSLELRSEEPRIVALAGQSGSGKTTAAQIALGFVQPTSGEILYRGTPVRGLGRGARTQFRRDVQAVLQDPFAAYNPVYRIRHVFDVVVRNFRIDEPRRRVAEAIEYVGLDAARVLDRYPHQLSGGERQRVMIARALLLKPRIIVADEPVSMVDASIRSTILDIILRLKRDAGISFLYVTHDLSTAYHIADEMLVLYEGETVERGDARVVIDRPRHDYTKLLIESVPIPDPDVRWSRREATHDFADPALTDAVER